jgi:hypothetical protein
MDPLGLPPPVCRGSLAYDTQFAGLGVRSEVSGALDLPRAPWAEHLPSNPVPSYHGL